VYDAVHEAATDPRSPARYPEDDATSRVAVSADARSASITSDTRDAGDLRGQRSGVGGALGGDHGQRGGDLRRETDGGGRRRREGAVVPGLVERTLQLFDLGSLGRGLAARGDPDPEHSESGATGEQAPPVDHGYCAGHSNILPLECRSPRTSRAGRDVEHSDHAFFRHSWRIVSSWLSQHASRDAAAGPPGAAW
jgi:hypothetical protein